MTRYIETRNEDISIEEVIALCNYEAKPYPALWYENAKSVTTRRNASQWRDYQDCLEAVADDDSEEIDWSEFSCPLNHWEYLVCAR